MKPTSRKPSPKATKCWALVYPTGKTRAHADKSWCDLLAKNYSASTVPAWYLTKDQIPAVIEAMAKAMHRSVESVYTPLLRVPWKEIHKERKALFRDHARAALRAAGVGVK